MNLEWDQSQVFYTPGMLHRLEEEQEGLLQEVGMQEVLALDMFACKVLILWRGLEHPACRMGQAWRQLLWWRVVGKVRVGGRCCKTLYAVFEYGWVDGVFLALSFSSAGLSSGS